MKLLFVIFLSMISMNGHRFEAESTPTRIAGIYDFRHPHRPSGLSIASSNVPELYVHDGEWGIRDGVAQVVRGQSYPEGLDRPTLLVYHAEREFLLRFAELDLDFIVEALAWRWSQLREDALPIVGIQLDFDLGRRGFSAYPRLLEALRAEIPDARLSVTLLGSHSNHPDIDSVAGLVDELAPMLYGYRGYPEAQFAEKRSRAFLADLLVHRKRLSPVLGWRGSPTDLAEQVELLEDLGIANHLVFNLRPAFEEAS